GRRERGRVDRHPRAAAGRNDRARLPPGFRGRSRHHVSRGTRGRGESALRLACAGNPPAAPDHTMLVRRDRTLKILVAGWFSFDDMGATAGDLLARGVVEDWLREAGYGY